MNVRREWFPALLLDHGIFPDEIERRMSPAQWYATLAEYDRRVQAENQAGLRRRTGR